VVSLKTNQYGRREVKNQGWDVIPNVESTTATIGGHGEEQSSLRVATGRTLRMMGAGHLRQSAVVEADSGL